MEKEYKSFIYAMFSNVLFVLVGVFVKLASKEVSSVEITFFRCVVGLVYIGVSLYKRPLQNKGGKIKLLIFRGFVGYIGLQLIFYIMVHLHISIALTYQKASTIFATLFALIFLKEKLNKASWFSIIIGFIGVILVAEPTGLALDKYNLAGIACAVVTGLSYMAIRLLTKSYESRTLVGIFMIISLIGSGSAMILANFIPIKGYEFIITEFKVPSAITLFYLLIVGLVSYYALTLLTKAFAFGKVGFVGTVAYGTIPIALLFDVIMGDGLPAYGKIIGMIIIIVSSLITLKANKKGK